MNRASRPRFPPAPPGLPVDAHKGLAGRVALVCGSRTMPGAALLAARAAQRAGAGLVAVTAFSENLLAALPVAAPEAVLLEALELSPRAASAFVRSLAARGEHALLAGPGLGRLARTRALVRALLEQTRVPLVLDADALNELGTDLERVRRARAPVVLTPHPGEAERLLGRPVGGDARSRRDAAIEISLRSGAICCLKGARTVVAEGERVYVNSTGNAGMATAGAGDVLAGILVAYLAACSTLGDDKWTPFAAAASAVVVHGLAGDLARRIRGVRGLVAGDLVEFLPAAQIARDPRELD
ncbi:MAG: NAD(P)H-hydrate dehydratase [Planctomycetes bacterium]|nr:NAD(P)H-hydrate dehydratase [Planctomycetota bacterium]